MLSNIKKRTEGFTIIEVLIVLAIAGLILLIVFLAVPALQRNSRNTQRKDDVSRISGAVQEFTNNNNGSTPTSSDASTIYANAGTLAYYKDSSKVTVNTTAPGSATNGTSVDEVTVYIGATCGSMAGGQGAVAGTSRQVAVVYTLEPSTKACTNT
jgi:prepilin-type N-terminal cleavage/methylation domain-containing protein